MHKVPTYTIRKLFSTKWVWFSNPEEASGVDQVVFFSYEKVGAPSFKRKEGLTTCVNLEKSEEEIFMGMRKKFIRKQITRGEERGISVREGAYSELLPVYTSFRKDKHLATADVKEASRVGDIFVAEHQGRIISAGLFISNGVYARAHVLASVRLSKKEDREIIGYANRMLLWEAMRFYKKQGVKRFDFGGINVKSSKKEDVSLAEFKEAFGGERASCFYYRKVYSKALTLFSKVRRILPI